MDYNETTQLKLGNVESLLNVSDQLVEVEGFIVPLEMDEYLNTVKEF